MKATTAGTRVVAVLIRSVDTEKNLVDTFLILYYIIIRDKYLRVCLESFGRSSRRDSGSSHLFPHGLRPAAQPRNPYANKSQKKPTQITENSRSDPCYYSCVLCISLKYSHAGCADPFSEIKLP
jgi:hypothetical protein